MVSLTLVAAYLGLAAAVGAGPQAAQAPEAARPANRPSAKDQSPTGDGTQVISQHDQDGDGFLTREELPADRRDLSEGFARADFDKDGKLSERELRRYDLRARLKALPAEEVGDWVRDADVDEPGRAALQVLY